MYLIISYEKKPASNEQIEEQTTSGDAGQYVQPQVWGKTSKDLKSVQDPNWPKYGGPKVSM